MSFAAALSLVLSLVTAVAPPAPASAQAHGEHVLEASVQRVSGASRLHTAVAVSQRTDPGGVKTVVLARADTYADALAGGPLAAKLGAPILLTSTNNLDDVVAHEIRRLGASKAILLGGTSALTERVVGGLRALGIAEIERISGATRFDTAAQITDRVLVDIAPALRRVYVAEGANADPSRGWPDALAASALASADGSAILLASGGSLPRPTRDMLVRMQVPQAVVVGGQAAVPASAEQDLRGVVGAVERVSGSNRFDTAGRLASRAAAHPGIGGLRVWLASGANWPDALVAGPAAARLGGVLLLTDPSDLGRAGATRDWMVSARPRSMTVVGGSASVGEHVLGQAGALLGGGLPPAPPVDLAAARPWSDPATWGGAKPAAGGKAVVPAGMTILLDEQPPALGAIEIYGTLVLADQPMTLRAGSIMAHGDGARFVAGQEGSPLRSKVTIVLDGDRAANVHGMGTNVLGAMGRGASIDLHGASPAVSWTRLQATARAGATEIVLQQPVDWPVGGELVVASTSMEPTEAERRTITAVDGNRVRLNAALSHTHWGETTRIAEQDVPMHAEVGLLTRNLVVRGPESQPDGFGGHTMVMEGATFRGSGTEFTGLGQRGANGRYPVHFHLLGDARGSYLRSSAVHSSNHRCVTIHGSSNVQLVDNVAFDAPGHCYFFEDGVETGNVLLRNLGMSTRIPASGTALIESDSTPATFWVQHPDNVLIGNVAAGSAAFGFWYDLPANPTGPSATPRVHPRRGPMGVFDRNVAHSNAYTSASFKSGAGLFVDEYHPPSQAVFSNFLSYKNANFGAWTEQSPRVVLTGATLVGNQVGSLGAGSTIQDSLIVGDHPNSSGKPWVMLGAAMYTKGSHLRNVTFANFNHEGSSRPHAALGTQTMEVHEASYVSGARFVNVSDAARVRVTPAWADGERNRTTAFVDVDGSVTGSGQASTIVNDHPLMATPGCQAIADWKGYVCPAGPAYGMIAFADVTGDTRPIGPVTVAREGGGSGPIHSDMAWAGRPQAQFSAQFGGTYTPSFTRTTPTKLEVIMASSEVAGDVTVRVPWPHASVYAYRGASAYATPLAIGQPGPDSFSVGNGVVTIRPYTETSSQWTVWTLCVERNCGGTLGSARPSPY